MAVLFLTGDMMFLPQLTGVAKELGHEVQWALSSSALVKKASAETGSLVVLDLSMSGIDCAKLLPELQSLPTPPSAVIAYGPHVHEAKLAAAAESGCDQVFTNGQFRSQMKAILAKYSGPSPSGA
jgi:CheY-like chemotaxis protein